MVKAYCLGCKAEREIKEVKQTKTKNGQPMLKGVCDKCGRKICKFVKKDT